MKTHDRVIAIVRVDEDKQIEVAEVLFDLSVAKRLAEQLSTKDKKASYLVCETKLRWRTGRLLQKDAKRMILEEWEKRADTGCTSNDMYSFFGDIHSSMPELLSFKCKVDPWQRMHGWLIEHERKKSHQAG